MSAHTPGPWKYSGTAEGLNWDITLKRGRQSRKIEVEGFTNEEANANAHLIAAAPEMLDALKFVLENSGDPVMENVCGAAIAKAEGRV